VQKHTLAGRSLILPRSRALPDQMKYLNKINHQIYEFSSRVTGAQWEPLADEQKEAPAPKPKRAPRKKEGQKDVVRDNQ